MVFHHKDYGSTWLWESNMLGCSKFGVNSLSQLLFNGQNVGSFHVKRSIRQGCPLSPLLFTIFSHSFVIALMDEVEKGNLVGIFLPNTDQINIFANDSILSFKVKANTLRSALQVIQLFEWASSLQYSIEKYRLIYCHS